MYSLHLKPNLHWCATSGAGLPRFPRFRSGLLEGIICFFWCVDTSSWRKDQVDWNIVEANDIYIILYIYMYIYNLYVLYIYMIICIIHSRISIHHLNQYIHRPKWLNHQISSSNIIIIINMYIYVIVETRVACSYIWNKPHQPTKIQGLWSENVGDSSWSFKVYISATIRNPFMTWTIGKTCLANHLVAVHR